MVRKVTLLARERLPRVNLAVDSYYLMEDGSYILMEDGSSKYLLEYEDALTPTMLLRAERRDTRLSSKERKL